jgi:hypothetical protein
MQLLDQNNLITKKDTYNMVAAEKKRKLEDKPFFLLMLL